MEEHIWMTTREILQSENDPLIRKPRLTEALLRRPPFRFLHDIVTAVQKTTGFMKDVFSETELDVKALANDREGKLTFLQKLIDAVDSSLDADPLKIIAGIEPESTNALLQTLGRRAKEHLQKHVPALTISRPPSRRSSAERKFSLNHQQTVEDFLFGTEQRSEDVNEIKVLCSTRRRELERSRPPSRCESRPVSVRQKLISRPSSAFGDIRHSESRPPSAQIQIQEGTSVLSSDSDIDIEKASLDEALPELMNDGALVRQLRQDSTMNEVSEVGYPTSENGLEALAFAFHRLPSLFASLGRCMERLLEGTKPIREERDFWRRETKALNEALKEAENERNSFAEESKLQEMDSEIHQSFRNIRKLKQETEENERILLKMLNTLQ